MEIENGKEWQARVFLDMNLASSSSAQDFPRKEIRWTGCICSQLFLVLISRSPRGSHLVTTHWICAASSRASLPLDRGRSLTDRRRLGKQGEQLYWHPPRRCSPNRCIPAPFMDRFISSSATCPVARAALLPCSQHRHASTSVTA